MGCQWPDGTCYLTPEIEVSLHDDHGGVHKTLALCRGHGRDWLHRMADAVGTLPDGCVWYCRGCGREMGTTEYGPCQACGKVR